MAKQIEVIPDPGVEVDIGDLDKDVISIGRDIDNEILVDSDAISRKHCTLLRAGSEWVLNDVGSTNGSWLNNKQVVAGQFMLLRGGDELRLASIRLQIVMKIEDDVEESPHRSLLIFYGDAFEKEVEVVDGEDFVIGTRSGDLIIGDEGYGQQHMSIVSTPDGMMLDISQMQIPVFLNGVPAEQDARLTDRATLAIGLYNLVVVDGLEAAETGKRVSQQRGGSDHPSRHSPVFTDRDNSFKDTVHLKTGTSFSGFACLPENDEHTSALYNRKTSADQEATRFQIILGVVLVLCIFSAIIYLVFLDG